MDDETHAIAESHSAEAVQAAAVSKEADTKAIAARMREALQDYFESRSSGRFIDINRIPFICDDIKGIHETQTTIIKNQTENHQSLLSVKNDLKWIRYIGGGFVLAAGLLALKALGVTP